MSLSPQVVRSAPLPRRPDPPPLRTDNLRPVVVGTALWGVALVLALLFHQLLTDDGHLWWIGTCAAGFGLGLIGLRYTKSRGRK